PEWVIGEAKSLGSGELFKKDDVDRLRDVAKKIPGSYLVAAVLRDHFTTKEKKLLTSLAKWGRRPDDRSRPRNPLILLTATELCFEVDLAETWKSHGGSHATFSQKD